MKHLSPSLIDSIYRWKFRGHDSNCSRLWCYFFSNIIFQSNTFVLFFSCFRFLILKQLSLSLQRIGLYLPSKAHLPAIKDVQGLEKTEPETKFIYVRFNKRQTRVVWVMTHNSYGFSKGAAFSLPIGIPRERTSSLSTQILRCSQAFSQMLERELQKSMLELLESDDAKKSNYHKYKPSNREASSHWQADISKISSSLHLALRHFFILLDQLCSWTYLSLQGNYERDTQV